MVKYRNDFEGKDEPGIRYTTKISYNATAENKEIIKWFTDLADEEFDGVRVCALSHLRQMYYFLIRQGAMEDRLASLELFVADQVERQNVQEKTKEKEVGGPRTFA